jgi:hypothetical protein
LKVDEHVKAVVRQVLVDSQCPGGVGAPVTYEHGFLNAAHVANLNLDAKNGLIKMYTLKWSKGSKRSKHSWICS